MFVCHTCAVFHINGDYSGTNWTESRVEEIAENLSGMVIFVEDEPHFVLDYCSGCGERGGDYYSAGYYDYHGELVTN